MKLILQNIGLLKHAEITLHKLCVIAGENDNGKSTIGKIVFCIVKAINRYREDLQESKDFLVHEKIEEVYFLIRAALKLTNQNALDVLRQIRMPVRPRASIEHQLKSLDETLKQASEYIDTKPEVRTAIAAKRNEIQALLEQPEDVKQSIENAFNKVFASEFDASLLLHGTTEGSIQLIENSLSLIHLSVKPEGVTLNGEVEPIVLKEATFIESPLILNNHDLLVRSQTLLDVDQRRAGSLGLPYTTLHTKDLFNKLCEPILPFDLFSQYKSAPISEIRNIIDGEVTYSRKERDFVFQRGGESVSIKNTASGIKVFGLLYILLANEIVTKDTLLIFDEPENHLHPKWQLKLAQVLVKLVASGVYILVSSHSPYLIEALKRSVDRAGLDAEARFALAEEKTIKDEDRLGDIFSVLAEPFEEFKNMDAQDLRDE